MTFQKGQSGNPRGRPPKKRALTDLLAKAGNKKTKRKDGSGVTNKTLLAELAWELAIQGEVELPNGRTIGIEDPRDWLQTIKFIYSHIDGPPKGELDLTSGNASIQFNMSGVVDDAETEINE